MSINAPQNYARQYATNIQLLLQQKGSKLRSTVTEGSYSGEQASPVDQVGSIEMQDPAGRFAPMGRVDAALDRRWVYPKDKDLPQLFDNFDKVRQITDPQSKAVENAVNAAGRQIDRFIISAALGTSKTGKDGSNSIVLPNTQKIISSFGASGAVGLTVAKLKQVKKILMSNDLDLETEEIFMPIAAAQHDNLLAEAQVIHADFNGGDRMVLKEGKLVRFLGINFIHTELVLANVSGLDYLIPCYAKSGMHLGLWEDLNTSVSKRNDLSGEPWQVYLKMILDATRLEEKKIVQVACR